MKKRLITVLFALCAAVCFAVGLTACGNEGGTYYKVRLSGKIDREVYYSLSNGEWKDEDGEGGTYSKDGDDIVFYITFFGETEEVGRGTVKDGVLKISDGYDEEVYVSDSHKHDFKEYKETVKPTCTKTGTEAATCDCGVIDETSAREIPAAGHDYENGECKICKTPHYLFSLNPDGKSCSFKGLDGAYTESRETYTVTIPAAEQGLPVTEIADNAFSGCGGLTKVGIPDGVKKIGGGAFGGCGELTEITLPSGVAEIGGNAFNYCDKLKEIKYAGEIESWCAIKGLGNVTSQGRTLFINGKPLTGDLIIPDGVEKIGDYAFYGCGGLKSVIIPAGVVSVGESAFYGCVNLTGVTIGDGVSEIGKDAFRNCNKLKSISVGGNNETYSSVDGVLYDKATTEILYVPKAVTGAVTVPDSVARIPYAAFNGCSKIESMTLPFVGLSVKTAADTYQYPFGAIFGHSSYEGGTETPQQYYKNSLTNIYRESFYIPPSLKSVTITGGNVLAGAFYGCGGLTEINLPAGISEIGYGAFNNCGGLTEVSIPQGVTLIGAEAFQRCQNLKTVSIPNGVSEIDYGAFSHCKALTEVTIPRGVTVISSGTFASCYGLTSVSIPDSVKSIGNGAFESCFALMGIDIPDGVLSIGKEAFKDCRGVKSITIPDSVTSIGENAFQDITFDGTPIKATVPSLALPHLPAVSELVITSGETIERLPNRLVTLTLPAGVKVIAEKAYDATELKKITYSGDIASWCAISGLKAFSSASVETLIINGKQVAGSLTIPDGVTAISDYAFYNCAALTGVTIPAGVKTIGRNAFGGCSGLTSLTINDGVKDIGYGAFANCTELTSVTIPSSVENIGKSAFEQCKSLTNVIISDGVKSIDDRAFSTWSKDLTITIPVSVVKIGYSAFSISDKIYYEGSREQWNTIELHTSTANNVFFKNNAG